VPPGSAEALTAVTLICLVGAVAGQIPAFWLLPVGKSVGFDVTTVGGWYQIYPSGEMATVLVVVLPSNEAVVVVLRLFSV
jgi:hypothetical protein